MSWLYLQAVVEDYLPPNTYSDGEQSAMSSDPNTPSKSSSNESKMDILMMPQSGMMPIPSTGNLGLDAWISSLRASRVSHSAKQESDWGGQMKETAGPLRSESFAKYDQHSHGWKTLQVSLLTNTLEPFSETWLRAGMVSFGIAYQQKLLEQITRETDSGYLPTPRAGRATYDNSHGKRKYTLAGMARNNLFPTPLSGSREAYPNIKMSGKPNLAMAVKMYRTPTKNDSQNSTFPPSQVNRSSLVGQIMNEDTTKLEDGGQLNPDWVEWLMGFPIGWTALKPLATRKFQKWYELHS